MDVYREDAADVRSRNNLGCAVAAGVLALFAIGGGVAFVLSTRGHLPGFLASSARGSLATTKTGHTDGLTDAQRVQWEKVRRKIHGFNVASLQSDAKAWRLFDWNKQTWVDGIPSSRGVYLSQENDEAKNTAKGLSGTPGTIVTVVVDLAGEDDPKAIVWYYDNGQGVKIYHDAPTQELAGDLRAYFRKLQTEER